LQQFKFLDKEDVLRIHIELVSETGEPTGILNEGSLDSAISQPQATWGGEYLHSTIYEQAAAYLFHCYANVLK
jgi:death on curing protein